MVDKCNECGNDLTDDELYYLENTCNKCECEADDIRSDFNNMVGKLGAITLVLLFAALLTA